VCPQVSERNALRWLRGVDLIPTQLLITRKLLVSLGPIPPATPRSSPRMKGRKIYGDLVPFGKVWRVGANEATTFLTSSDLIVAGKTVPAGSYTIFTVPGIDRWTLIINKKTGEWGIPYKYKGDQLGRLEMKVSALPAPVENFTIAYDKSGNNGCTLRMHWETTRASVDITPK
jgi:Protein of unknown function (DUF2911)